MQIRTLYPLLKDTWREWSADKVPRLGAALAYYSVFAIAPLLIIVIGVAGAIFGRSAAEGKVVQEIRDTVGQPVAMAIQEMLANNYAQGQNTLAIIIGIVTLLIAAMGVFTQLHDALNTVWKVAPKSDLGIWGMVKSRFLSLIMVVATGTLLLASLILSAVLSALSHSYGGWLPGESLVWHAINIVVPFIIITLSFAMIYKYLPNAEIAWHDVWVGSILTALLFTLGKYLLGWYLGRPSITSAFGAAGALIVILMWVYYSSQILLFGAEFTRVYAGRFGSGIKPSPDADPVSSNVPAGQGMPRQEDAKAVH